MVHLILASQSADRLKLLRDAGYAVTVFSAPIVEPDPGSWSDPAEGVAHVACLKALAARRAGASGLILAADTVGLVGGRVFGKPADRDDARRMLDAISGSEHEVLTGWCLLRTRDGVCRSGAERTKIVMRAWSVAELEAYLDSGAWQGRSGAYALQLPVDPFVVRLEGSVSNVVGLPLERLESVLRELPETSSGV